jgi:hypothetical protein
MAQRRLRVLPDVFLPTFHKRVHATSACTSVSEAEVTEEENTFLEAPDFHVYPRVYGALAFGAGAVPRRAAPTFPLGP